MKNITLSADEKMIEAARERARAEHTTLNEEFRRWLADYARRKQRVEEAMAVIERLQSYASTGGRRFTRDDMNDGGCTCLYSEDLQHGQQIESLTIENPFSN